MHHLAFVVSTDYNILRESDNHQPSTIALDTSASSMYLSPV
jgi:hypothetical protein